MAKLGANQPTMELSMTGVVGRVVQEHEDMRHRSLEKLGERHIVLSMITGQVT